MPVALVMAGLPTTVGALRSSNRVVLAGVAGETSMLRAELVRRLGLTLSPPLPPQRR
jgi:hypothetical protein